MSKPSASQHEGSHDEVPSRYVVGIDLGTTNSAAMYVDTSKKSRRVRVLPIPQLVAPGQSESLETLPSFHYQPATGELPSDAVRLPGDSSEEYTGEYVVGSFARDHGALVPGRMIASAKSWLCHSGVDRTGDLLPWHGATDVERISPVEVSACYLRHIRSVWDARFPKDLLSQQDIVLTLPASFDEVARELTVQAAASAGLARVFLIEEPQAAFYAWLDANAADWDAQVEPGHKILVCDIGGGTSDFTLIRVRRGEDGKIDFHRVAVGDHLILGGDNLDLALAHHLERRFTKDGKLEPRQWDVLVATCRRVKELLLGDDSPPQLTVTLPGSGSQLIGGSLQIEVTRDEVRELLVDGFLPQVDLDEKPAHRSSGFQEFGLPYAPDPAITKYLAAFLTAHRYVALDGAPDNVALDHATTTRPSDPARPDIVLLNGGFFESSALRERLLKVLSSWFQLEDPEWRPRVLAGDRLHLAVARGAAYYAMVRRGEGVRIAADLARTYYVGVESEEPAAVCLVPATAEAGRDIEVTERRFNLRVSQPVEFPLYVSSTRLTDDAGQLVPVVHEEMKPLPPIRTVLRARKRDDTEWAAVHLHSRLTEIGTLELGCSEIEGRRGWRLQFDVRSATQTDIAAHQSAAEGEGFLDEAAWQECQQLIEVTFASDGKAQPAALAKRLGKIVSMNRTEWPTSFCRRIWEALILFESGRRRSHAHETRWLNLLGFALRPGYGLAVDDWRVAQTWRIVQGKLYHGCRNEMLILWRRISGGLSAGQQRAIAEPVLGPLRALHRRTTTGKSSGGSYVLRPEESAEVWRLLASLELLSAATKIELGNMLLDLLPKRKLQLVRPAMTWGLGRLGTRMPLYGPLNSIVPLDTVIQWVHRILDLATHDPVELLAIAQLARRTDDRYRDLPDPLRKTVLNHLESCDTPPHYIELVSKGGQFNDEEQGRIFGESLPKGLRIL